MFFRLDVNLPGYLFYAAHTLPSGWTHIVLNYIGPDDGIRMYYGGEEVTNTSTKNTYPVQQGNGRIVIGRVYTDFDNHYASLQMDELIFFNASLTSNQVERIYDSV